MPEVVVINPITRLEGHRKVTIFLTDEGEVSRAYFQVPELRGFENFLVGRQAEYAPQITSRIFGVCPTPPHTAAPKASRNVLGVIQKAGLDIGKRVIAMRKDLRAILTELGGKVIHPVYGLPGGVAKPVTADMQTRYQEVAGRALKFAAFCEKLFEDVVLGNPDYVKAITSDAYTHRTHYMGLVDAGMRENFYEGQIRVVDPSGREIARC